MHVSPTKLVFCIFMVWSAGAGLKPALAANPTGRNLIFITIDTLRADYLSYNGSQKVKTPNLDALASRGVNFQRARASVPLTLPSHASILTGLYPPAHGVRDNATFRLDTSFTTLAEILKKNGYHTGAFVGSFVLDRRFGLNQGFDVYDDRTSNDSSMLERFEAERDANVVYKAATQWLESTGRKQPFFLWMHLYDPHAPYLPPKEFARMYPRDPYAGEVAYTDFVVGRLMKKLEELKLLQQSIIAITGDHGEGLGEHQESTHSVLIYNSTLHVPMIIVSPGQIAAGRRVEPLCRTIDLAPTLLDYLGFQMKFGEGTSLRNLIEGKPQQELTAYSESLYPKLNLGWSELTGIESARYRFIHAPRPELYEIEKDPGEKTNRIATFPEIAKRHLQELQKISRAPAATAIKAEEMDPETREKLGSLGYISGSSTLPAAASSIDPKEKIGLWNEIQAALFHMSQEQFAQAIQQLKRIASTDKNIPIVYDYLGNSYMHLEDWNNAEQTYRDALKLGFESALFRTNLGIIHFQRGEYAKAGNELRRAIELEQTNVSAHYHLGNVFRAGGKLKEAAAEYQKALDVNPNYVFAWNGLGMTHAGLKQDEQALRAFQRAIQVDPSNAAAYFNLAIQLERMKQIRPAIDAYKKFLEIASGKEFAAQRKKATEALTRLTQQ